MGTWHSIYEAMQKSSDDNVVVDSDVMMENCHNNDAIHRACSIRGWLAR